MCTTYLLIFIELNKFNYKYSFRLLLDIVTNKILLVDKYNVNVPQYYGLNTAFFTSVPRIIKTNTKNDIRCIKLFFNYRAMRLLIPKLPTRPTGKFPRILVVPTGLVQPLGQ